MLTIFEKITVVDLYHDPKLLVLWRIKFRCINKPLSGGIYKSERRSLVNHLTIFYVKTKSKVKFMRLFFQTI